MGSLAAMRALEQQMREQEAELERLKQDPKVKADLAFEHDVIEVCNRHGRSLVDAIQLIAPDLLKKTRTPRAEGEEGERGGKRPYVKRNPNTGEPTQPTMRYTNPHTGEEVLARNILRNPLPAWVAKYGKDVVKSWKTPA